LRAFVEEAVIEEGNVTKAIGVGMGIGKAAKK
jgi:hypothetical protein